MFRSQQIKELLYGVRFKILLLLFFTVFPLLLMILYNGYEQRHQAIKETQQRVFNIAKDVHLWQSSTFRTIYETLVSLSNDPMIASLDPGLCSSIFSRKFKMGAFPQCLNAGLIDRNGYLICSFIEPDHGLFLGDRDYFKSAIENRGFSSGGILRSRITGKNILVFAYPVLEENSEVKAVISAGFDLSWFNNIYQHPFLYEDSTITLIDSGGIVIGRSSDSGKYIGKSSPDTEIIKTVLENKQGVTEATGLDGKLKIYGFHPLWPISGGAYIYVGVDKDSVLSRINESVIRNLLWLFLANSVGIALALIFSQKYFVSNLNKLIKATQKISKGQWDVRTGLTSDYGELAALGQAFDKMAQELGEREKAQKMAQEEILKERNFKESVIQSLPGIFYVITSDLKYLRVNRNHVKFTGYSEEEILKMSPLDLFEGDDAETISQAIKKVFSEDGVVTAEA
ncbi:MAG: PAS domain S-box protein, partial [Syntrophaceae bacterium]|nr:PAS domain S-box protein [Syntrophaceae bacterium]